VGKFWQGRLLGFTICEPPGKEMTEETKLLLSIQVNLASERDKAWQYD
jgi:hypothetical protein